MNDTYLEKVIIYKKDVVCVRTALYPPKKDKKKPVRGDVFEFSFSSRKKLAFVASNTDVRFLTLLTLTYPKDYSNDGKEIKKNLRAFLQYLRRVDGGGEYLWFLEFQKRGAPHFHILSDIPYSRFDLTAVSERWYKIVGSNDKKHLLAGTNVQPVRSGKRLAHYAVKYAMKMRQKRVPKNYRNVGRFWGNSSGVKPKPKAHHAINNEDELKLYLLRWLSDNRSRSTKYKTLFNATEYMSRATGLDY